MDHDIGQVLDLLDESVQLKVFEIAEVYEDFCEGLSYAIKEKFRLLDESVQLKVLEVINKKRKTLYHHFSFKSWLHNIWDDFTYDWMEGIGENFNSLSEFVQHKIIELVEKDNKLMLQKIGFAADDYTQKYSDTVKLMYREGNTINIRERRRFCETRLSQYNWKAAVDIVGPSNLVTFAKAVPEHWKRFMGELVGDPEKEEDFLKERSPITYVDLISRTTSLLVIQGANDPRVVKNESDQIVERLKSKNMDVEYLIFEDEGHGFTKYSNLVKALKKSAEFLVKKLSI